MSHRRTKAAVARARDTALTEDCSYAWVILDALYEAIVKGRAKELAEIVETWSPEATDLATRTVKEC